MAGPSTTAVEDLVQRVFPETLFRRLREPREEIIAVDGSALIPQLDTDTEEATDEIPSRADAALPENIQHPSPSAPTEFDSPAPSIEDILGHLCDSEPLYSVEEKRWIHYPNTSTKNKEHEIAEFLNKVLGRVRHLLFGTDESDDDWVFSAQFSKNRLEIDGVKRKLDLILARRKFSQILREHDGPHLDLDWKRTRSLGEIKFTTSCLGRKVGDDPFAFVSEMFGDDLARRFVLKIGLFDTEMALYKYDRSGILVSPRFSIHQEPKEFLRAVVGMAFGEDYYLGLDPSFSSEGGKDYVMVEDTKYEILEVIQTDPDILGRGTIVLLVRDPNTGQRRVIKDQWVDRDLDANEIDILGELKADGKERNVVRLEKGSVIAFRIGNLKVLDSTENDRKNLDGKYKSEVEIRDHYRLVLTPYGASIMKFESLKELISAFKDYAETIHDLYKDGYYHRDISYPNLIIVTKHETMPLTPRNEPRKGGSKSQKVEAIEPSGDDSGVRTGFLIDLDCAITIESMEEAGPEFTGTVTFMPIEILENCFCKHKYYFDLESLFYVLVWVCLVSDGPRREDHYPKSGYDFKNSMLDMWNGGSAEHCGPEQRGLLRRIGCNKRVQVTNVTLFEICIIRKLSAYFKPIETLLHDLRGILFQPPTQDDNIEEDKKPINERTDVDRVFKRYIDALERARAKLPARDVWPDPSTKFDKAADSQGSIHDTPDVGYPSKKAEVTVKDRESVKEIAQDRSKPVDGSNNKDYVDPKKSESGRSSASDSGYSSSKQSNAVASLLSKRHRTHEGSASSPKRICSETAKAKASGN